MHNKMSEKKGTTEEIIQKKKKGLVVSDKMDKTVVVSVTELKTHPRYSKKFKSTKNFKIHDEKNEYKVGDKIYFVECRPLSKDKCWKAVGLVSADKK